MQEQRKVHILILTTEGSHFQAPTTSRRIALTRLQADWFTSRAFVKWHTDCKADTTWKTFRVNSFRLIRSLVDPTLAAFIVCGPLQFVLLLCKMVPSGIYRTQIRSSDYVSWPYQFRAWCMISGYASFSLANCELGCGKTQKLKPVCG